MYPTDTVILADIKARQFENDDRRGRAPSRLDYQRRTLERKKMQTLDYTLYYMDRSDLDTRLERQRQIIEHIDLEPGILDRIRTTFGRTLIAVGERIRPGDVVTERIADA